ncbi:hypothetical protein AB4491_30745, partial [Vibrio sp. 10N.261.45.A7]
NPTILRLVSSKKSNEARRPAGFVMFITLLAFRTALMFQTKRHQLFFHKPVTPHSAGHSFNKLLFA